MYVIQCDGGYHNGSRVMLLCTGYTYCSLRCICNSIPAGILLHIGINSGYTVQHQPSWCLIEGMAMHECDNCSTNVLDLFVTLLD